MVIDGKQALEAEHFIHLSIPEIRGNEWKYIKECLDTNWVSSVGEFVDRFEHRVADYIGGKYGVAMANGTAALHIALLVAGVQPDDEVLVSTLTFISPANTIRYVDAWPIFIDAEPYHWQMDPQKIADFLKNDCRWKNGELLNKVTGRRIKAILPVHILGHPVDMDPILELAQKYELLVIEDASESLGAMYKGKKVGSLGDIACFSFNGNKLITTGGGGMIVTDDAEWAEKARYLTTQAKDDPLEYVHKEIGYNYRLTNIQAAMGVAQMEQLDNYIAIKRKIATAYENAFTNIAGVTPMRSASWALSTYWLYTLLVDDACCRMNSRDLLRALKQDGIQTRPLWTPIHCSPAHSRSMVIGGQVAEEIQRKSLSIPCSVGLTDKEQDTVINRLRAHLFGE
jgi:perosamine synthetase